MYLASNSNCLSPIVKVDPFRRRGSKARSVGLIIYKFLQLDSMISLSAIHKVRVSSYGYFPFSIIFTYPMLELGCIWLKKFVFNSLPILHFIKQNLSEIFERNIHTRSFQSWLNLWSYLSSYSEILKIIYSWFRINVQEIYCIRINW